MCTSTLAGRLVLSTFSGKMEKAKIWTENIAISVQRASQTDCMASAVPAYTEWEEIGLIKGIVMDFDGLIFDTEWHHYEVYRDLFQAQGATFGVEEYGAAVGSQGVIDPPAMLAERTGQLVDPTEFGAHHDQEVHRRLKEQKEPRSGVRALIQQIQSLDLRLGLASSSDRVWVERWLKHLQLWDAFEVVCTRDDVEHVKPDPALYTLAAEKLGLSPQEILVFEDSVNGSEAARKAGTHCVVVTNRITEQLAFGPVHRKVRTFLDLDLTTLLEELR